jgi:hypothetical protein
VSDEFPENYDENVLTGIHSPYTMSGTNNRNEVDELMVKHFLNTLAEIALSIASRKEVER